MYWRKRAVEKDKFHFTPKVYKTFQHFLPPPQKRQKKTRDLEEHAGGGGVAPVVHFAAPVNPVHYSSRTKEATVASITLSWLMMMMTKVMICSDAADDDDDDDDDEEIRIGDVLSC